MTSNIEKRNKLSLYFIHKHNFETKYINVCTDKILTFCILPLSKIEFSKKVV